jgi:HAMP domain-containing protein
MSLRYKALIAVVVLVAFLTGFLVVSSSTLFERDARERIDKELLKDQGILEIRINSAATISATGIKASAASSELVQLFNDRGITTLAENLYPFAQEWRTAADGDIALAAIDAFVAEDRGANILGLVGDSLAFVSIAEREPSPREQLLKDPELQQFLSAFYNRAYEQGDARELPHSDSAVLPVAGRVYLVVQNYLWESVQEKTVIGVGVVLTELSRDWLERSFADRGDDIDDIEKIVFTGETVASSTLESFELAESILRDAREREMIRDDTVVRRFDFEIEGETFQGVAFSSVLSPDSMPNRPGFVAFKSLDRELAPFVQLRRQVFLIGAGLGLLAAVVAYFGAWLVISKLRRLEDATKRIRQGAFDTRVKIGGRDELAKLGKAFNDMTTGLKALGMYTHETLAKNLLDNPELLGTTSTREEGSIFFSDIKGFTGISEGMEAEALTSQLNEYFAALGTKLKEERGYVDKFIGDSIMAFWARPSSRRVTTPCAPVPRRWSR